MNSWRRSRSVCVFSFECCSVSGVRNSRGTPGFGHSAPICSRIRRRAYQHVAVARVHRRANRIHVLPEPVLVVQHSRLAELLEVLHERAQLLLLRGGQNPREVERRRRLQLHVAVAGTQQNALLDRVRADCVRNHAHLPSIARLVGTRIIHSPTTRRFVSIASVVNSAISGSTSVLISGDCSSFSLSSVFYASPSLRAPTKKQSRQ